MVDAAGGYRQDRAERRRIECSRRGSEVRAVKRACSYCEDVEFSAEDAFRSDVDFLCQVTEAAIDAGAKTINIPDTVGYAIPSEFGELIRIIR